MLGHFLFFCVVIFFIKLPNVSLLHKVSPSQQPFALQYITASKQPMVHPKKKTVERSILKKRRLVPPVFFFFSSASLVPTLAFGENDLYDVYGVKSSSRMYQIQQLVKRQLGFTLPVFNGRGIFNCKVFFILLFFIFYTFYFPLPSLPPSQELLKCLLSSTPKRVQKKEKKKLSLQSERM